MSALLQPCALGKSLPLRNRICMAALTRNRCTKNNMPTEASVTHYADRARYGTGLIISEGIFVFLNGNDMLHTPVMFTREHAAAWKLVTDAVHKVGGKMFFQAWHAGRVQNENMPMLKDNDYPVLAPSNIPAAGGYYRNLEGGPGHSTNITEITDPIEIIAQYQNSARLAKEAGFDGIEILAQGGYLLHTFLLSRSNHRSDKYGGSVPNRCRFVLEVIDAMLDIWTPGAIGIKICPTDTLHDSAIAPAEISELYGYLIPQLTQRHLGYINLSRRGCDLGPSMYSDEQPALSKPAGTLPSGYDPLHEFGPMIKYPGSPTSLMVGYEYSIEEAEKLVLDGKIDMISFGRPFIYNPDLVARIEGNSPIAGNDRGPRVNYGPYVDPNENYNDWKCAVRTA